MARADYSTIAEFYDQGRTLSEQNIELWLRLISESSRAGQGAEALDLGCGTGRFALPMAKRLGYRVTGADVSAEMLAKARGKDTGSAVTWERQDGASLMYAEASFDVVFMSHLLHHVAEPKVVVEECYRVLRPSGSLLVRYGALEQIRQDVVHTCFPEAVPIDEARTPTVTTTEGWLTAAGFTGMSSQEVVQQTYRSGEALVDAVRARCTSVLTLIPQEAFEEGLRRVERHVRNQPDDAWPLFDRMTLTVGQRPSRE